MLVERNDDCTPLLLTVAQVAHELGLSRSTVYLEIASGRLRSIRVGRARRVPRAAVEQWVADRLAEEGV
jgi:excisionase family DNA binding protein